MKAVFVLMLLFNWYCVKAYTVTIYGTATCGYTTDLRNQCTKNNVVFEFVDVNTGEGFNAMAAVVSEFSLAVDNYVDLPVVLVVVDGRRWGLVRPTVEKIKQLVGVTSVILYNNKVLQESEIYDLQGQRCRGNLKSGVYLIRTRTGNRVETTKYIKHDI
jgi:glutaredoxin